MAIKNRDVSALTRLKNQAKEAGMNYQMVLQLFLQEEFLRRLTGAMHTGWTVVNGKSYFLNPYAPKQTWFFVNGTWQFNRGVSSRPFGALYVNAQTPDGKTVNADGVKIG